MMGRMRHRLTVQEKIATPDGAGGLSESWQDIAVNATLMAEVRAVGGAEPVGQGGQIKTVENFKIITRYRADLTAAHRLLGEGVVYSITAVLDRDGRRAYLEVTAFTER